MWGEVKWKHVTQDPLKRNPAQQKKGTYIVIKSSQGKSKNHKYYSCTPHHTQRTHILTHSSPHFPSDDWEDGKIGAMLCLLTAWIWQDDVWKLPDHGMACKFLRAQIIIITLFLKTRFTKGLTEQRTQQRATRYRKKKKKMDPKQK